MRTPILAALAATALVLSGCSRSRCCERAAGPQPAAPTPSKPAATEPTGPSPAEPAALLPPTAHALYTGAGAPLTAEVLHARVAEADVVLFGELHGNAAGSHVQHELLKVLAGSDRPFALAMEFFERDVQADLDAYLAGSLEEAEFLKRTRQSRAYPSSHRPLIELCKAEGAPVIAANAPRPLVRAFRKTKDDYPTFLAGLSDAERASLPRTTTRPDDVYRTRFMKLMGPKRGPSFFRSQALWDDAMAEAVADFRAANPDHVVILMVGAFHVSGQGGTLTKLQARRPNDKVLSLAMSFTTDTDLPFDDEAKGAADVVMKVHLKPRKTTAPNPHQAKSAKKRAQ